jgi:Di-haem oxidoreductase, putative peroxidase
MSLSRGVGLSACLLAAAASLAPAQQTPGAWKPDIPKVWDDAALRDWATPLAGLNARPTHVSSKEYYGFEIENLRTYPVYFPGREPEGYWKMLQQVGPQPLIVPEKLHTENEWVSAGRVVFEQVDFLNLRTRDPKFIEEARSREQLESAGVRPLPDGTLVGLRWVPTREGVAISSANCSFCHTLNLPDGSRVPGAPFRTVAPRPPATFRTWPMISRIQKEKRVLAGAPPFYMGSEPIGMWLYRAYGVPWIANDVHERLKDATQEEYEALDLAHRTSGALVRWNGSLLFPAKIPDLIGIKDRKYIDHTATHLHRDIGDLMRYAALVTSAESTQFGPHRVVSSETRRTGTRLPDESLYALALYIYSLQPPANPNPFDDKAHAGQAIFRREGCPNCHTPPLYTSNKITLASGFELPKDKPATLDVLAMSVGTDPGLARQTRKGTGYYKVPSLKGLWYRGHYLHDGSSASLEEMFDPDRLKQDHVPGGWTPLGTKTRAIPGHNFGLKLSGEERGQLIAFLRSL